MPKFIDGAGLFMCFMLIHEADQKFLPLSKEEFFTHGWEEVARVGREVKIVSTSRRFQVLLRTH